MRSVHLKALTTALTQTVKSSLKVNLANTPIYFKNVREEVIYKKAGELNNWYTKIIGLDEVKLFQLRVVDLQERLLDAQERRRSIGQKLAEIRKQSNELQDKIHKVKRQDDFETFLNLMRTETEVLQSERETTQKFNECDREEREIFTAFTNAVRDSHEKQRAQLEYTKYFGLILSVAGSFLTFCYSTLKKQDLKKFIEEHLLVAAGGSQQIAEQVQDSQDKLNKLVSYVNSENAQIVDLIGKNHSEILNLLNSGSGGEVSLLDRVYDDSSDLLDNPIINIVDANCKIVLLGCAALVGMIIIRSLL